MKGITENGVHHRDFERDTHGLSKDTEEVILHIMKIGERIIKDEAIVGHHHDGTHGTGKDKDQMIQGETIL